MTIHNEPSRALEHLQPVGFMLEVTLSPGIGEALKTQFERNLQDYMASQGWICRFTRWQGSIQNEHADLTLADQCDVLTWLAAQPNVCSAVVSDLEPVDDIEDIEGRQLRMTVHAVPTIAGSLLYRLGLITPEVFAQVLGGFIEPSHEA
jgi:hypothetical protein